MMRRVINVLIGLLGVLLALGIGFSLTQRMRDVADRSRCRNNPRQIAEGLHQYADINGFLPAATFGPVELEPDRRLSWLYEIDPYMHARMDEEWTLYKKEPWDSANNRRLASRRLHFVVCPRAPSATTVEGYTITSYVGVSGIGRDAAALPVEDRRAGAFGYSRRIKFADINDGMAQTVVVIETADENGPWMAGGRPTTRGLEPDGAIPIGRAGQFGGLHYDGVFVAFADGSVRFLKDSISPETLAALFTIAGREEVGAFEEH